MIPLVQDSLEAAVAEDMAAHEHNAAGFACQVCKKLAVNY